MFRVGFREKYVWMYIVLFGLYCAESCQYLWFPREMCANIYCFTQFKLRGILCLWLVSAWNMYGCLLLYLVYNTRNLVVLCSFREKYVWMYIVLLGLYCAESCHYLLFPREMCVNYYCFTQFILRGILCLWLVSAWNMYECLLFYSVYNARNLVVLYGFREKCVRIFIVLYSLYYVESYAYG